MSSLNQIRLIGDPVLEVKTTNITSVGPVTKRLDRSLQSALSLSSGLAVAAPQVGVSKRCFGYELKRDSYKFVANPEVLDVSKELVVMTEGCLSIPGFVFDIERPEKIKVRFIDIYEAEHVVELTGLKSRMFQHEIDHLDGVLLTKYLNAEQIDLLGDLIR